jgi:hypothetical protein
MNWGTHICRSSCDRSALIIRSKDGAKRRLAAGGGYYNHSSFNQSIIIVDEKLQNPTPAKVVAYDVEGPVQHVQATSDEHYPGTAITRTFALIDDNVLVVDRVASTDALAHTVDWSLLGAGRDLSVPTQKKTGSWTTKPYDNTIGVTYGGEVKGYEHARIDETWSEGGGRLTMLGSPGTGIYVWNTALGPGMMARRTGVKATDFVALFSLDAKSIERVPVARADGKPADAVGVEVTLDDGKTFHAVVNYEPEGTEVVLGDLRTKERFATDYRREELTVKPNG